jgi:hypothetical protein
MQSDKMIFLFKCALAALYVVMGVVCFFIKDRPVFAEYPQTVKWAFCILCIVYGAFRLYRAINIENE